MIKGLAEHKDTLGAPLCPCRHYDDKEAEAAQGFWNCPCVPMRERKVRRPFICRLFACRVYGLCGLCLLTTDSSRCWFAQWFLI